MKTFAKYFPLGIVVLAGVMVVGRGQVSAPSASKRDLYGFGAIPVQHGGRVQPIDSLARNSLVVISGKTEVEDGGRVYKASEWLLTLWSNPEKANKFKIIRADHPQVLSLLGLPQRPGFYRYSMDELEEKGGIRKLESQAAVADKKEKEQRDSYDEKVLLLARQLKVYRELEIRKNPGLIPAEAADGKWMSYADVVEAAAPQMFRQAEAKVRPELAAEIQKDPPLIGELVRRHLGVRTLQEAEEQFGSKEQIVKYVIDREVRDRLRPIVRQEFLAALPTTFPPVAGMEQIVDAFGADNAAQFNAAVAEYHNKHTTAVSEEDQKKARLEARMNHLDPFLQCAVLYIGVAILAALSWLVWEEPLRKAAFYLVCLTLVIHTAALLSRMYIVGRPPVTNLYSSAVFIGWGGVALCLVLERLYKLGIASFVAGVMGFSTVFIARFLSSSGDTLEMLQAVLDTNFWLATHVTTVASGYVATFVAGLIALVYIVRGVFTDAMRGEVGRQVAGMIYGTLCFATLLSFTGTVLGGIWADVSWGRFWGWDPKENGAVLVVIWNTLILHARWGGLVKARGMAILAVIGNMVGAWSWFGTNQLGIGLHAYGFDNRLATGCAVFWVSQLLIAGLGLVPLRHWASVGETQPARG